MAKIYVIGSLRGDGVRWVAAELRDDGHEVFDDWHASGPEADDIWQTYEQDRGHGFVEALTGKFAKHVLEFDKAGMEWADIGLLVLPAGKSGHLELGAYFVNVKGKEAHILMEDEPDRWDQMYGLATGVWPSLEMFRAYLRAREEARKP